MRARVESALGSSDADGVLATLAAVRAFPERAALGAAVDELVSHAEGLLAREEPEPEPECHQPFAGASRSREETSRGVRSIDGGSGSDRASQIELAISQMEALNHELVGLAASPGWHSQTAPPPGDLVGDVGAPGGLAAAPPGAALVLSRG